MEILHHHSDSKGKFYIETDGKPMAELVYIMTGPKNMTILHTEVDPSLEGKGVGKQLLEKLIAFVRKENIKVLPQCSFAALMFKRVREWQDVLSI
jgi:uncharacterized protein